MPKKNFDQTIKQLDGTDALRDGKPLMMRSLIAEALTVPAQGQDGESKLRAGLLAFKLATATGEQDFKAEELAALKKAVGDNCGPLVVAQVFPLIDK